MNKYSVLFSLLLLTACSSLKNLRLESAPVFTEQTYWLSQQYGLEYQAEEILATYVSKISKITPTHYHLAVSLKDQPQVAYTIQVRRIDLAIDGFISSKEDELKIYVPLLSFPLFKGKVWTETLRTQDHPRSPVKEIPATFEVKDIVAYDYLPKENLAGEKKAFLIEIKLPDQTLSFHYIPPTKKFPGTSMVDLYLQLDLNNPNAPKMRNDCIEYVR